MPIYEYACEKCGTPIEVMAKVDDPPPKKCEHCGAKGKMTRQVSRTSFVLKGGGWYSDLYGSTKKSAESKSESSSSTKSETRSETRSDSKSSGGGDKGGSSGGSTPASGSGGSSGGSTPAKGGKSAKATGAAAA